MILLIQQIYLQKLLMFNIIRNSIIIFLWSESNQIELVEIEDLLLRLVFLLFGVLISLSFVGVVALLAVIAALLLGVLAIFLG